MKLQLVRNATLLLEYGSKRFLIDPLLAEKGAYPGFPGTANSHLSNPLVDLPVSMDDIKSFDAVIVTHTHPDHWDEVAKSTIPKDSLIFVQDEHDEAELRTAGFTHTQILTETTEFQGILLSKTPGQHGSDEAVAMMPEMLSRVCGIVFRHPDEKTLYIAGDTLWNDYVRRSIENYLPQIIALNCGDARVDGLGSIIMGKDDVHEVYKAAPQAKLVATHMEAVNHCVLSRSQLREYADNNNMTDRLLVPEDGDSYSF